MIDPLTYISGQRSPCSDCQRFGRVSIPYSSAQCLRFDPSDSGNLARTNIAQIQEPTSAEDALTGEDSENWKTAMNSEINTLLQNGTWDVTKLTAGRKSVGCRWSFKMKYNVDGTVEKCKARLVAKGYSQVEGTDYFGTFVPVRKFASRRSLLAIAAIQEMEEYQKGVKTAFLNGDLKE